MLPEHDPKTPKNRIRYAPSFKSGDVGSSSCQHPYAVETLRKFLNWKAYRIESALFALELIESGLTTDAAFTGLTSKQAEIVGKQTKRAFVETGNKKAATAVGKHLSAGFRASAGKEIGADGKLHTLPKDVTIHTAKRITDDLIGAKQLKAVGAPHKRPPPIDKFALLVADKIGSFFSTHEAKLKALIEYRADIPREHKTALIRSLRRLAKDAEQYATKIEA